MLSYKLPDKYLRFLLPFLALPAKLPLSGRVEVCCLGFAHHLLLLDPPVLEPDSHLALGQVGGGRNPPPLLFGDEFAGRVLLLQLLQLDFGVRDPLLSPPPITADFGLQGDHVCKKKIIKKKKRGKEKKRREGNRRGYFIPVCGMGISARRGKKEGGERRIKEDRERGGMGREGEEREKETRQAENASSEGNGSTTIIITAIITT